MDGANRGCRRSAPSCVVATALLVCSTLAGMKRPAQITLAIETSNPSGGSGEIAIGRRTDDGACEVLALVRLTPVTRHDDALMPAIEAAARGANVRPADLDRVAVSIGPGGFTALRTAVATAKLIAEATGASCVPVPSALVAAHHSFHMAPDLEHVAIALAGKRESAWVTRLSRTWPIAAQAKAAMRGSPIEAERLRGLFDEEHPHAMLADAHLPRAMRAVCESLGIPVPAPIFTAEVCLAVSWELEPVDAIELTPIYPREPEAVTKWRELHG